jgi:hypothetical protein
MKYHLSPEQNFWFGIALVSGSSALLALTIRRFEWLKKKIPSLLFWGRSSLGYPASRVGCASGCFVGITVGCLFIEKGRDTFSSQFLVVMLASSFVFVIVAAIHDFRLHKLNPSTKTSKHRRTVERENR